MEKIITELLAQGIIESKPIVIRKLTGGTVSELYLLEGKRYKYVVKCNAPVVVASESYYLETYHVSTLLPTLLRVHPNHHYMVYSYIDGFTLHRTKMKKKVLRGLVEGLINHYRTVPDLIGWGWIDEPTNSWVSFLVQELNEASVLIGNRLEKQQHQFVYQLLEQVNVDVRGFLLHGDLGIHNFIFNDSQLVGVIDPTPIVGIPLYDLVYAFCSSAEDLSKETFDYALSYLNKTHQKNEAFIYATVLIGLYLRMAACLKHHPEDYKVYVDAWYKWVDIVKNVV